MGCAMTTAWRPRPVIVASMGLHAAALVAAASVPQAWPWALAGIVANHAYLTFLTMSPDSQLLGRSLRRLPPARARGHIALTFDDGPDPEVTPRILDALDRHGARATFFCIGAKAQRHPELVREIAARGHAIGNHTMRHCSWFTLLGLGGQRREWREAGDVLHQLGVESDLARTPLGLRSPLSDLVLHQLGLRHVGWSRRGFDTRCGDAAVVLDRIARGLREGDIILLHDAGAERDAQGEPVCLAVLEALLLLLAARGLTSVRLDG
ncbi:polysaccharide deacetylase family protein [Roseomonas arctica]|uniref:Chitooligosaccharide deacetylase n=2 Tax=Plastoroseomonas arctica TaxID=1509237 RepID=A0AAF1JWU0_9PROT|nr:polysaccharide deacetylase family protein [Plastoroseomonas arctica]